MTPAIGITFSLVDGPDNGPYLAAVERAGGRPLQFANDLGRLEEQLALVDGVILSGGVDVGVGHYGGSPHEKVQSPRPERDEFELALARVLRARGIPTLGICRGLQLANVAFGGTLIEDLPSDFGERYTLHHQQVHEDGQDRSEVVPEHLVRLEPDSALARLVESTAFATNSMHHQAVRSVAPDLRAVARTYDGVIEALDANFPHPFFYLVQWHPEELPDEPASRRLFDGLIGAARQAALERA